MNINSLLNIKHCKKVFDNTVVQNSDIKKFNESKLIKPNLMQEHALKSLESLRNVGEEKGLIISATGTGKNYFMRT